MYSPRHLPVLSLEDVTANFEQLKELLGDLIGEGGSEALIKAIEARSRAGAWTAPESITAKLEAVSVEARTERDLIHYRGNFTAKEAIKTEENLLTMPSVVRPSAGRFGIILNASSAATGRVSLEASGVMRYVGAEIGKGSVMSVEGIEIVK